MPRIFVPSAAFLYHDLRRSMARNARNEGAAQEVIMEIVGWKTAKVFRRYSIVNPADTAAAISKVDARRQRDFTTVNPDPPNPTSKSSGRVSSRVQGKLCKPPLPAAATRKLPVLPN
jgi:hypothetical protein